MPPKRKITQSDEGDNTSTTAKNFFDGIIFSFSGTFSVTQSELIKKVENHGSSTAKGVTLKVTHLVSTAEDFKKNSASVQKAKKQGIFIVSEQFIHKCIEASKKLDEKDFIISDSDDAEDEEEEEEEEKVAPPPKRGSKKAAAKRGKEPEPESEESEEDTNKLTTRSKKKTKNVDESKSEKSNTTEEFSSDIEDSDDDSNKVTVKVHGRAAVDMHFPDKNYHVYDDGKDVYDATLNQTEIAQNNNKFYIIQILESDNGQNYTVWNRWGREGLKGIGKRFDYSKANLHAAISLFNEKFFEKTKNPFNNRKNFRKVAGKYDLIELDYSIDDKSEQTKSKPKAATHKKECTLDERVQDLIKLIFDVKMMKRTMAEAKVDLKKMPLGKLSKTQITKGYMVLKEIEEVLLGKSKDNLVSLSSKFYTAIPHVSDNVMQPPPTINSHQMLLAKMTMLQNLADIEIATTLIKEAESDDSNILESHYKNLKTEIIPLDRHTTEFKDIETYVINTYKGKTPEIINVFKIDREGEADRFKKSLHLGNRKLLWHGSRLTNFVGIISQGLRIAPPEAPVSGYRFGKGIYFADIMSLSANYCRTSGSNDFCMLLGDVTLGKTADLYRDQYMEKPINGTNSTLALGSIEPDPKNVHSHTDGYTIPYGKIVDSPYKNKQVSCLEHQYIVYSVDQVQLKYLLQLKY
ncbi:hypothetical protein DICPUDRAFT_150569 [Dictyostelium purpureum]|uniref:Poly [ADP-ribose] polymerase n=1 Tax=Dictyostelium purpureum TaxID=5786 RepID=F0ZGN6_DICPU|nr:uncharacterized protein DICPUDRAFT_150569 [Dictyostelium purpureum]EGC36876.1 hypothetical protein DICPUDRAFT_150569 [Dictyostelium purpureum]|eukprot:XP_003286598.1 hypothetical protein DICPUDRAFT_150569 [Dictyostelium purpureum]